MNPSSLQMGIITFHPHPNWTFQFNPPNKIFRIYACNKSKMTYKIYI